MLQGLSPSTGGRQFGLSEVVAKRCPSLRNSSAPSPLPPRFGFRMTGCPEMRRAAATSSFTTGNQDSAGREDTAFSSAAYWRALLISRSSARLPLTTQSPEAFEPSQHRGGEFGGIAMVAGMRRGAHAVVEDSLGGWLRQIEDAVVEEPIAPRQPLSIERLGQRLKPGGIFV